MRRRGGYTLVECLIAIALIGVTMTVVAVAMSGMHRACRRVRQDAAIEMELQRFAAQFRADAHLAVSAQQEDSAEGNAPTGTLLLTLNDRESVRYTLRAQFVERQCAGNDRLRETVERLLVAFERMGEFLEEPAVGDLADESDGEEPP